MSAIKKTMQSILSSILNKPDTGSLRLYFKTDLPPDLEALEISPFFSPVLNGSSVKTFEIMTEEEQKTLAVNLKLKSDKIKIPDFISKSGDLVIDQRFSLILSSHCIEHTPDLIKHLHQVHDLLTHNGIYVVFMPDRRYCFDALKRPQYLSDVLEAYYEKRTHHTIAQIIQTLFLTTHNDSQLHWKGENGQPSLKTREDLEGMITLVNTGKYIDTHAWQFTDNEFFDIYRELQRLGFFPTLSLVKKIQTSFNSQEFAFVLQRVPCAQCD
jgi:SAM-dependent methyltransferase